MIAVDALMESRAKSDNRLLLSVNTGCVDCRLSPPEVKCGCRADFCVTNRGTCSPASRHGSPRQHNIVERGGLETFFQTAPSKRMFQTTVGKTNRPAQRGAQRRLNCLQALHKPSRQRHVRQFWRQILFCSRFSWLTKFCRKQRNREGVQMLRYFRYRCYGITQQCHMRLRVTSFSFPFESMASKICSDFRWDSSTFH